MDVDLARRSLRRVLDCAKAEGVTLFTQDVWVLARARWTRTLYLVRDPVTGRGAVVQAQDRASARALCDGAQRTWTVERMDARQVLYPPGTWTSAVPPFHESMVSDLSRYYRRDQRRVAAGEQPRCRYLGVCTNGVYDLVLRRSVEDNPNLALREVAVLLGARPSALARRGCHVYTYEVLGSAHGTV